MTAWPARVGSGAPIRCGAPGCREEIARWYSAAVPGGRALATNALVLPPGLAADRGQPARFRWSSRAINAIQQGRQPRDRAKAVSIRAVLAGDGRWRRRVYTPVWLPCRLGHENVVTELTEGSLPT